MPGLTRVCTSCHTCYPTINCVRQASPQGRIYYYCPRCAPRHVHHCAFCSASTLSSRSDFISTSPLTIPPNAHYQNTGPCTMSSGDRIRLCAQCADSLLRRCTSCHTILAAAWPGPHCRVCAANYIPCLRCGQMDRNAILANYTNVDHGRFCSQCYTKSLPPTTFCINKSKLQVGIELEYFHTAPREAHPNLSHLGLIKPDGSLHIQDGDPRYESSGEFNSFPTSGDRVLTLTDEVVGLLNAAKAFTNRTCGLHIHIDVSTLSADQRTSIIKWWAALEPIFFTLVGNTRQANKFCCTVHKPSSVARYYALNTQAFERHKTFEIRLHEGVLDADRIKMWILTLLNFFETFKYIRQPPADFSTSVRTLRELLLFFFQQCRLPLRIRKYMLRTANHLHPSRLSSPTHCHSPSPMNVASTNQANMSAVSIMGAILDAQFHPSARAYYDTASTTRRV